MRVTKKPEDRRQEIMETAMALFAKQGYQKTAVEDITKAMNVAKGSFYNYFKSKQEALEACIASKTSSVMSRYLKILTCGDKTASERLREYIEYNFDLSLQGHKSGLYDHLHSPELAFAHNQALSDGIKKILPVFVDLIDEGKNQCGFHSDDSEFTASALLGALREVHNLLASREGEAPDRQRLLIYGLIRQILGVDIREA